MYKLESELSYLQMCFLLYDKIITLKSDQHCQVKCSPHEVYCTGNKLILMKRSDPAVNHVSNETFV